MAPQKTEIRSQVSLKELARHLGLNPATVSVVLNDEQGRSIPQATRDRIKAAAQELNYRPSLLARSLRNRRTMTIGVLVPELNDGYHTQVMTGVGDLLIEKHYFYFTAHHRHKPDLVEEYCQMLIGRGAEALIVIDTHLEHAFQVPVVAVAGHRKIAGVTNVVLDQMRAAELTLEHLCDLGHREIAFMRGPSFSSDADDRWRALVKVARRMGVRLDPALTVHLTRDISTPELGYPVIDQLLASRKLFTALVCFNDIAAIGAIRALQDRGLRVPEDVSVIGFDDITASAYHTPSLTTIRQPLAEMGRIAAECALERIEGIRSTPAPIPVSPELVARESTGAPTPSPDRVEPPAGRGRNGRKAGASLG
jgi:DNA-binding LacI/PurR family transcriptional regulator